MKKIYNFSSNVTNGTNVTNATNVVAGRDVARNVSTTRRFLLSAFCLLLFLGIGSNAFAQSRLYWIGGEGDWSTPANWTTNSNGIPSGNTVKPNSTITVVFNNFSFTADNQMVSLNEYVQCDSMIWEATGRKPVFDTKGNALQIYGSLQLQEDMSILGTNSAQAIYFDCNKPTATVITANVSIPRNVAFRITTTTVTIMDSLKVTGTNNISQSDGTVDFSNCPYISCATFTFTDGNLNLSNSYLTCTGFNSTVSNARTLNITNATIVSTGNWTHSGNSVPIVATGSFIKVGNNFIGSETNNTSQYNVVEAGVGLFYGATFKKIIVNAANNVLFNNIAWLTTSVITDSLVFITNPTANRTARIVAGTTLTVREYLGNIPLTPNCNQRRVELNSGTAGTAATIQMVPGAEVDLTDLNVSWVNITTTTEAPAPPATPYPVSGLYTVGNPTGWEGSNRLYWVGRGQPGVRNWTDTLNWSLTSGGAPQCRTPNQYTTVIFDNNSFVSNGETVTVNSSPGVVDSMIWEATNFKPNLTMGNFHIYGSLQFQPNMNITAGQTITWYNARGVASIKTCNHTIGGNFSFATANVTYVLRDSLIFTGDISMQGCIVNANGKYIKCNNFSATSGDPRLNITDATVQLAGAWQYQGNVTPIQATGSTIKVGTTFIGRNAISANQYNVLEAGNSFIQGGKFKKIIMNKNNAKLNNNLTATDQIETDSLILQWDRSYFIHAGSNVKVNNYLGTISPYDLCPKRIKWSSTTTSAATITMGATADVEVGGLDLSYINIGPGTNYPAPNSTGVNSTGWDFNAPSLFVPSESRRLYWVGGPGNWSDPAHWSGVSGGVPGYCMIPETGTTVVFDAGSGLSDGDIVRLNVTGFCDSMIWDTPTRPIFSTGSLGLEIHGSLILENDNMTMISSLTGGYIGFYSTRPAETIQTNSAPITRSIIFNSPGNACTWTLADSLKLAYGAGAYDISYFNGGLNFANQYVKCGSFISVDNNARALDISGATIEVNNWTHTGNTVPVVTTGSTINVGSNFTGNSNIPDRYEVVHVGAGALLGATYRTIIMDKNNGMLNLQTPNNNVVTDTLILSVGNTYRIFQGSTVYVKEYLGSNPVTGSCDEKIVLRSNTTVAPLTAATVAMAPGVAVMNLSNIDFYYINFTGDTPYSIPNASNLGPAGTSNGWISTGTATSRLYWVNGPGDWTDRNHWSLSPGGIANACITPSATNTVIFNDASGLAPGDMVTLDANAFCDSMLWQGTGSPVFNLNNKTLTISGSLELQAGMTVDSLGLMIFNSGRTVETIKTNGVNLSADITFNNAAGVWTVLDTLKMTNGTRDFNLLLSNGKLMLADGSYLKCGDFNTGNVATVRLDITNATVEVNNWTYNQPLVPALTLAQTGGSLIKVHNNFTGHTHNSSTDYFGPMSYNVVEAGAGILRDGTFNKIIMNKNAGAMMPNSISTDSLILQMGNIYFLGFGNSSGGTVNVNKFFGNTRITGNDCSEKIAFMTANINTGYIKMPSGSEVDLMNVDIYNISLIGTYVPMPYNIPNSRNLGGVTLNWVFDPPATTYTGRLYWVGGTGNWHNAKSWSRTPGGAPSCDIPTKDNTVVFDNNSGLVDGTSVTSTATAYCDSMLWIGNGNPQLRLGAAVTNIHGSLVLQRNMTMSSTGTTWTNFQFNSIRGLGETIKTNGVTIARNLTFNTNGTWTLEDSLTLLGANFYQYTGTLNFGGNYVKMNNYFNNTSDINQLNIAGSVIDITDSWVNTNPNALITSSANSLIRVAAGNFSGKASDNYNVLEAGPGVTGGGNFKKIILRNHSTGSLNGTNVVTDTLILSHATTNANHRILAGTTLIINKHLGEIPNTACLPRINLVSTTTGTPAFFDMGAGATVKLTNVGIRDIHIGPNVPYPANYIDLGGNDGWTYVAATSRMYWIGGQGNWNVLSNWSSQSGGAPDLDCLPNATTTVVFDQNSGLLDGSTVTLTAAAACDSMIWENLTTNPIFNMQANALTISGSLQLHNNVMLRANPNTITFNSGRPNESIITNGVNIPSHLVFNSAIDPTTFTLADAVALTNGIALYNLTLTNGNLTNTTLLRAGNFTSTAADNAVNINNSVVEVNNWTYTGNVNVLNVLNAVIKVANNFTGNVADTYDEVIIANGTVVNGNFNTLVATGTIIFNNSSTGVINTNTLTFAPGSAVARIFAGSTVNVAVLMEKTHTDWLGIFSTTTTAPGYFNMGAGSNVVGMDKLILNQNHITGPGVPPGTYPTNGSVNQGNNVGWFITSTTDFCDCYYWVGLNNIYNFLENWDYGYPGSGIVPNFEPSTASYVYFLPRADSPASVTLNITNGNFQFKNFYFNAGNNVTIQFTGTSNGDTLFVNSGSLTISGGTTRVNNLIVNEGARFNTTNANVVDILQNLTASGTVRHNSTGSFTVRGNTHIQPGGFFEIIGNPGLIVNLSGSTWVEAGAKITYKPLSYISNLVLNTGPSFVIDGDADFLWVSHHAYGDVKVTGRAVFSENILNLRSTTPYIFEVANPEQSFFNGSINFYGTDFALTTNLIVPTTDVNIRENNLNFTGGAFTIKTPNFRIYRANNTRLLDFSGTLIEPKNFAVIDPVGNTCNFATTTISFWGTGEQTFSTWFEQNPPPTIGKVTYSETANRLNFTPPTHTSVSSAINPSAIFNAVIDTLITGSKMINLGFHSPNYLTANYWQMDNYCDIYSTGSPIVNVSNIVGPPTIGCCDGYSYMHSHLGYIYLNRIPSTSATPLALRNLYFRNVKFGGDPSPYAFTSPVNYNLGDNQGKIDWTTPADAECSRTYYWIGGTGSWFDGSKWSLSSGGDPIYCVPNFLDTAIFDNRSFTAAGQTVTIDSMSASIHNIHWTDPTLRGGLQMNNLLEVFGSLDLTGCRQASNSNNNVHKLIFYGTGNETIKTEILSGTPRHLNISYVLFRHTGTYTLLDNFKFSQPESASWSGLYGQGIHHLSGNFVSDGFDIQGSCFNSVAFDTLSRSLNLAGSTIKLVNLTDLLPIQSCAVSGNVCQYNYGTDWHLDLRRLTDCNLDDTKIIAYNVRTTGSAGQTVQYHDVEVHSDIMQSTNLNVSYNDIHATGRGNNPGAITNNQGRFAYGFTARNLYVEPYKTYTFKYSPITPNEFIVTEEFKILLEETNCSGEGSLTFIQGDNSIASKINAYRDIFPPFVQRNVQVTNINSIGKPYIIINSREGGNNTNVILNSPFEAPPGKDFFWVPNPTIAGNTGAGRWDNCLNWSIGVSGGDPRETNPYCCIPTKYDNVFFDINSFRANSQTVTLTSQVVNCNNMTWTAEAGARTPIIASNVLMNIYGSLELVAGLNNNVNAGGFNMLGTSQVEGAQTIRFNGFTGYLNMENYFDGGGRYDILDSALNSNGMGYRFYVRNGSSLHLQSGQKVHERITARANSSFYTHGNPMTVHFFVVDAGTLPRTIDLSGSTITTISGFQCALDAFTTANLDNATINIQYRSDHNNFFNFNNAASCSWSAENSAINSATPLWLHSNAAATGTNFVFHNIIFTGQGTDATLTGTGSGPFTFNKLQFGATSYILNASSVYTMDTLAYAKASTNYVAAGKYLFVNELITSGDPCGFISIQSTAPPTPAYIYSSNGCKRLTLYFARLNSIWGDTRCTADAYHVTGHAHELINIQNWTVFDLTTRERQLLGPDTVLTCKTTLPYILDAEGFGKAIHYDWYFSTVPNVRGTLIKSGTEDTIHIWKDGYYALRVAYGDTCFLGELRLIQRRFIIDQNPPVPVITTSPMVRQDTLTCYNPEATLTANYDDPESGYYAYVWKDRAGNIVGNNQALLVNDSSLYRVIITNTRNFCVDSMDYRIWMDISYPEIDPIIATDLGTQLDCDITAIQLTASGGTGDRYVWNAGLGNNPVVTVTSPGEYFVISQYIFNGCTDTARITITAVDLPIPPNVDQYQQFCAGATIADLNTYGVNIKWYANPMSGVAVSTATPLQDGATYYASQSNDGNCESGLRSPVFVSLVDPGEIPAPVIGNQTLCPGATFADIQTNGNPNIVFFNSGGVQQLPGATVSAGTYTAAYSYSGGSCTGSESAPFIITLNATIPPPSIGDQTFCPGAIIANILVPNNQIVWYADNVTFPGTPLSPGIELIDGTTYWAAQSGGTACNPSTRVPVLITLSSDAGVPAPVIHPPYIFCDKAWLGQVNVTGYGVRWFNDPTNGTPLPLTTEMLAGTYTFYAEQQGNADCASATRVPVTVLVEICSKDSLNTIVYTCDSWTEINVSAHHGCTAAKVTLTSASLLGATVTIARDSMVRYAYNQFPVTTGHDTLSYTLDCDGKITYGKLFIEVILCPADSNDIDVGPDVICVGQTGFLYATTATVTNPTFRWYASQTSTTVLFTGDEFETPPLTTTTTYYVSVFGTNKSENLPGNRRSVTVTVKPRPTLIPVRICD